MFVDASALVAVLLQEEGFEILDAKLIAAHGSVITEFALMESGLAILRERGWTAEETDNLMRRTLSALEIVVVDLTSSMILTALKAFERYGKGRGHPARLNMGDCLSYAAARELGLPLLYKGDDFARTDIVSALAR